MITTKEGYNNDDNRKYNNGSNRKYNNNRKCYSDKRQYKNNNRKYNNGSNKKYINDDNKRKSSNDNRI